MKWLAALLATVALGVGLPIAAAYLALFASQHWGLPSPKGPTIWWLYSQHAFQLALGLVAILLLKPFVRTNYGLRWPKGKTYFAAALRWGAAFGVIMVAVDYSPELLAHTTPKLAYPLTTQNVAGWLFLEGIWVGPTEEIPIRALLVSFLAATLPGRLSLGRFSMNWAGIIVALIFALLHATSFLTTSWPLALGQQAYAFALGVLYAYWLEKSGSIVAPIIGHNASDFVEYALLYSWIGLAA